jgi:hypothetical protein
MDGRDKTYPLLKRMQKEIDQVDANISEIASFTAV